MNEETPNQFPQIRGPMVSPSMPSSAKRPPLGLLIKIIAAVVIGVLMVGGILLGFRIWDPVWNPMRPSPEKVLGQMLSAMAEVKTVTSEFKADIEIIGINQQGGPIKLSFTVQSSSDRQDPKNLRSTTDFNLGVALPTAMGGAVSLGGKIIVNGEDSYFKLTSLDIPPLVSMSLMMAGFNPTQFTGQWVKADKQTAEVISQLQEEVLIQNLPGNGQIQQNTEQAQAELTKKLAELFVNSKIYYVQKQMPDQTIEGQKMYYYRVGLDTKEISRIVASTIGAYIKNAVSSLGSALGEIKIADAQEIEKSLQDFFDKIGPIAGDIYIGKKDLFLHRLEFQKDLDISKLVKTAEGKISVKIAVAESNFNEPVRIEIPKNFQKVETILAPFIEQYKTEMEKNRITADMSQLRMVAADIAENNGGSYTKFNCMNSVAKPFCDDVKSIIGVDPVIRVSARNYCSYVTLPVPVGSAPRYYCLSNYSSSGEVGVSPAGRNYCMGNTFKCPAPLRLLHLPLPW